MSNVWVVIEGMIDVYNVEQRPIGVVSQKEEVQDFINKYCKQKKINGKYLVREHEHPHLALVTIDYPLGSLKTSRTEHSIFAAVCLAVDAHLEIAEWNEE